MSLSIYHHITIVEVPQRKIGDVAKWDLNVEMLTDNSRGTKENPAR